MLLLRRLGTSCRTAEAALRHAAPSRALSAAATAHRGAAQGAPHTISAAALAKRAGAAAEAEAEAGLDAFCWQAARGLAAALPPPTLLRAAAAPGAAAEGGAPAAALRAIDAWLVEANSALPRGRAAGGGEPAAAVAAVGVQRSSGDAGQASGCQGWRAGQEPALAERTESMQMSSVLKKRRAKIKKHWCVRPCAAHAHAARDGRRVGGIAWVASSSVPLLPCDSSLARG